MSTVLKVKTILVCRNSMLREGLRHILSKTRFALPPDGSTGGDPYSTQSPDTVPVLFIIDANLHGHGTADAIRDLKEQHEGARVVVLADGFDLNSVLSSLEAGVDGYCLATIGCEALVSYLDLVMLGEVVFPAALVLSALSSEGMVSSPRKSPLEEREPLQITPAQDAKGSPVRTLSSREAEILQCLVQGAPNKVIARKLEVAEATVKVHIKAILRKIRVANRTQAAMWAVNHLPTTVADPMMLSSTDRLALPYPQG